jgi:hypothetical protein
MSQNMDFDRLVADWLHAAGPADIRSEVVERSLGTTRHARQRRGLLLALAGPAPWPTYGRRIGFGTLPPAVRIALALALVLALAAASAVVGARLLQIIQPHPTAQSFVITTFGPLGCPAPGGGTTGGAGATVIDVGTAVARPVDVPCVSTLLLSPDGIHAVGSASQGLVIFDLRDGTSGVFPGAEGTDVQGIQWSPKGTYLYWVGDNTAGRPTTIFVSSVADARHTPLPTGIQGGYGAVTWSLDERRLLAQVPDANGWLLGNGDGTGFRALTDLGSRWLAMSPDGLSFAVARDRTDAAGTVVATDVLVGDGFSPPNPVTSLADGGTAHAAVWLPDRSALAVVVTRPDADVAQSLVPTTELELIATDRIDVRTRRALPAIGDPSDRPSYRIKASQDGHYVAVSRHTITRDTQGLETHREWFVIVRLSDGAILPTPSQRPPELTGGDGWTAAQLSNLFFSPDSRRAVYHVPGSFQVVDLDGSGVKHLSLSDVAPLGWANQLVWLP